MTSSGAGDGDGGTDTETVVRIEHGSAAKSRQVGVDDETGGGM